MQEFPTGLNNYSVGKRGGGKVTNHADLVHVTEPQSGQSGSKVSAKSRAESAISLLRSAVPGRTLHGQTAKPTYIMQ